MNRTPHGRRLDGLSMVVAAVPFGFALIRAVSTGSDFRYFWVALAGLLGAVATVRIGRAYGARPAAAVALAAGAFLAATLLAVLAALSIGTALGPGILVVGSAFGVCFAVGSLLHLLARP